VTLNQQLLCQPGNDPLSPAIQFWRHRFGERVQLADTHVLIDTPEQAFAEYMAHPTATTTGRTVHHLFTGRLVAENGQIKLLRESLNPVAVAQALLPGGVKDLPDPEKVIFSVQCSRGCERFG
jgi:hypothetical protein